MNKELRKASAAKKALPIHLRKFYVAHYQLIPDTGKFVGLVCRCCNCWQEYGHDSNCGVKDLEKARKRSEGST